MADGTVDMNAKPTEDISVREVFGIDSDMKIKGFADRTVRNIALELIKFT